ncbi:hypothetical protein Aab01nite_79610 [Paractinoplanes abujensis]|uniref:Golgi phosphoprotein 3 GPP34 n=1 Tax=Paractinoplanes abujensis TaxID=882441 RepID=A0A7W7CTN3_9ACTN|nr:GPP34 family phosphoprotein [Actinoplanes abujensis]MBB4693170.1 hypothetical protein [Actinoplanes abujensis]GID24371.1 hypothetical protein Aab01nite_79610 [Actinoplanes abujensis]
MPADHGASTLAEDLLLLLFQPDSAPPGPAGATGESTLAHALAGAVLTELGLGRHVRTVPDGVGAIRLEVVAQHPPADDILRHAWDYLARGPRGIPAALDAIGPDLRDPLVDRLVGRGDLRRSHRTALGVVDVETFEDGGSGRRERLLAAVRETVVEGARPQPRIAALAALLSASGTLPQYGPGIPWTAAVVARAKKLEQESWGATATAAAIARTVTAAVAGHL